jgi:hypothetical protein
VTEAEIQNAIFVAFGREPDVTLWRNNTGQAKAEVVTRAHLERLLGWLTTARNENQFKAQAVSAVELIRSLLKAPTRFTRYGLAKGSSDIIGVVQAENGPYKYDQNGAIIMPRGIFMALEVKREGKRPEPEQQMFLDIINRRGGVGRCVHSVEEARAAIDEARSR